MTVCFSTDGKTSQNSINNSLPGNIFSCPLRNDGIVWLFLEGNGVGDEGRKAYSGSSRGAKKVSVTTEMSLLYRSWNGVLWRWPYVELSAYESVRKESFQCSYTQKLVSPLMNLEALYCGGGISIFIFSKACKWAESSKSCDLIGSESGRYFTILPANPGGIVGSFIHKFICCLWMSKNLDFLNHFSFKTYAVVSIS